MPNLTSTSTSPSIPNTKPLPIPVHPTYKLIPFDVIPIFLAIAVLGMFINLLVLLTLLCKAFGVEVVDKFKDLRKVNKRRRKGKGKA